MESRKYDMVVLGASGFTGRHVVKEIHTTAPVTLKWAVAGRNKDKLRAVLQEIGASESIDILIADTDSPETMAAMCQQCRVLINVTGPYRFHGEPVVQACVDAATDYLDICGEPEFLERCELRFNQRAMGVDPIGSKPCLIIGSCGFDSVPADFGTMLAKRQFIPPAVCASVETFVQLEGGQDGLAFNATTFEAAVHGVGSAGSLKTIRKEAVEVKKRNSSVTDSCPYPFGEPKRYGAKPPIKNGPFTREECGADKSCFLFPGADASVIKRTQERLAGSEPSYTSFHVGCYFMIPSGWMNSWRLRFYGGIFQYFSNREWGRKWLLSQPERFSSGMFTKTGPTEKQVADAKFTMHCIAKGYSVEPTEEAPKPSSETRTVTVRGPDPGYASTSRIIVQLANIVLDKRSQLPRGGVFTPGFVFCRDPQVMDHTITKLEERQIYFETKA